MTLKLPKLGVSMQEGTITEWLVSDGERVEVGQPIYLVETEKATTEVESPFSGSITFLVGTGQSFPVGTPIARIETV
jgi:pyruvate/2-oxoglutarate dehydrogenase complex dihydrolipoamide acyltransferase (E2) component